ncbi:Fe2+-dependent dioxygenase [Thiohalomonas denitrificans]|uniref:Fe2+-dependent dioxygenase n=1 Tax=Thiohalomonas denitrificans TaxID=415747 RepID=UPI0026EA15BF|nr:Fe2+-dependent dioxygenase [Thiohalomonas denitrificans]
MLLRIPGVLSPEELTTVANAVSKARFVDGRLTAGKAAEKVKKNLELDRGSEVRDPLNRALVGSLYRSEPFRNGALPYRVATPIIARYTPGMRYGDHIDDPIMGPDNGRYRTDVSCTIALSGPEEYQGGELVIRTPFGEQHIKLNAGDAVIYPSGTLHRVEEVTAGERLVAVLWIQSLVRDPEKRELLYNLSRARESLLKREPGSPECDAVDHSYINLMRMWSEL